MEQAQECRDRDITITPTDGPVAVRFNGRDVARSEKALDLKEGDYPVVIYVPLADVDTSVLEPTDHRTTCPFKGIASYYSLHEGDAASENAVWYYPDPCPLVAPIKDHVAFWGGDIEYVRG